uniref:Uncharacterized protein n=1 Tax=uncultured Desulfobacterium sp. TaxID=201089 RepID=E1YFZ1_9BACT|nr:unknown protein [uncultured Desulfobacterium sp.]
MFLRTLCLLFLQYVKKPKNIVLMKYYLFKLRRPAVLVHRVLCPKPWIILS